jgi:hypothetical protein
MDNKRGQAAIEFLVTYGWAIMAAMVVIGALTYFGITNPATVLPDKCTFSNGFECKEYIITNSPDQLRLKLINGFGQTIYNPSAIQTETGAGCTVDSSEWAPDDIREVVCTTLSGGPFEVKEKAKVKVSVGYSKTPGGYSQVSLGEIYATVQ